LECGILLVTNFSFKKYTKFSASDEWEKIVDSQMKASVMKVS